MNKLGVALLSATALVLAATAAEAQATRTWVSGVGDDANPCSRTAPCKTFAGAISKTANGGEINVLDPGGFGGVTITKSITISAEGVEAGVLVSGTNGMIISATSNDVVTLRGLDFEGLGTGLSGIKVISAKELNVENCTIRNFTVAGIDFEPNVLGAALDIRDTVFQRNAIGLLVKPTSPGSAKVMVNGAGFMGQATAGLKADSSGGIVNSMVSDSTFLSNGINVHSLGGGAGKSTVFLVDSELMSATTGVQSENATSEVRLSNVSISRNQTGLASVASGAILSFQNNHNDGNLTTQGTPTGTIANQ